MNHKKKILVAPLDWGLGHATRCIPVIHELLNQGADVLIASDGRPLCLLQKEFPQLEFYRLKGYGITYQQKGSIILPMMMQIPKLIQSVSFEHKELNKIIKERQIDGVISDNRFGLHSKRIPCVFITHQLNIIIPSCLKWLEGFINKLNRCFINRYYQCWIPDFEGENNLSGLLTKKSPLPVNAQFIGALSRFEFKAGVEKEYDVLAVLSGPEPQRTLLENLLTEQLKPLTIKALIVQGAPEQTESKKITEHLSSIPFLNSEELNHAMLASDIIISRSGYSTIMDLAALGKKALFIPTPGQTEQEYLAKRFKDEKNFYSENQSGFNLRRALNESNNYSGLPVYETNNDILKNKVAELLKLIEQ